MVVIWCYIIALAIGAGIGYTICLINTYKVWNKKEEVKTDNGKLEEEGR